MVKREWFEIVMIIPLSLGVIFLVLKDNQTEAELTMLKQQPSVNTVSTGTIKTELPDYWQNILDSLTSRIGNLESQKPEVSSTITTTTAFQPQTIYLGQASTTQRNWTETGQEATINSQDYPSEANAVFEAGLSIVGGEAWARLK